MHLHMKIDMECIISLLIHSVGGVHVLETSRKLTWTCSIDENIFVRVYINMEYTVLYMNEDMETRTRTTSTWQLGDMRTF